MAGIKALDREPHRPRTFSASSSSSASSSHSPSPSRTRSRPGWSMHQQQHKPSRLDTTPGTNAVSINSPNPKPLGRHSSPARRVPESPPSSPLPLSFRTHSHADLESEDDFQLPPRHGSVTPSNNIRRRAKERQLSETEPTKSDHDHSSTATMTTRATTKRGCTSDINTRPRFTLSTNVRSRPASASTTVSTRSSPSSTKSTRSTSSRERVSPRTDMSTVADTSATTTHSEPFEASSSTKASKSRTPTTITTTTMSTTRRVVSTTINVRQCGDFNHRKESTVTTTVVAAKGRQRLRSPRTMAPAATLCCSSSSSSRDTSTERASIPALTDVYDKQTYSTKMASRLNSSVLSGEGNSFEKSMSLLPAADVDDDASDTDQDAAKSYLKDLLSEEKDDDYVAMHCLTSPPPSPLTVAAPLLPALTLSNAVSSGEHLRSERLCSAMDRPESYYPSLMITPHIQNEGKDMNRLQHGPQALAWGEKATLDVSAGTAILSESSRISHCSVGVAEGRECWNPDRHDRGSDIASTTGPSSKRTSLLVALKGILSDTPLTKIKDPVIMHEVMRMMMEKRLLREAPATVRLSASIENSHRNAMDGEVNDRRNDHTDGNDISDADDNGQDSGYYTESTVDLRSRSPVSPFAMAKITLQAKRTFLQLEEARRANLRQGTSDTDALPSQSMLSPPLDIRARSTSPFLPSTEAADTLTLTQPLPTCYVSPPQAPLVDIPRKTATILNDMGYPPLYSSLPSTSASPSLLSPFNAQSRPRSTSSMSLHSSFPERLFQSRSPSPSSPPSRPALSPQPLENRSACLPEETVSQQRPWLSVPSRSSLSSPDVREGRHENVSARSPSQQHRQYQQQQHNSHEETSGWPAIESPFPKSNLQVSSRQEFATHRRHRSDHSMYQHSDLHPPRHHNDTLSNFDATDYDAGQGRLYDGVQEEQRLGSHMHDISMLTKRLANLQLMDSLCPSELPQEQREQHQQPSTLVKMDSTWSSQIQLLLVHLADQADLEEKSIHPILTSTSISNAGAGAGVRDAYGSGASRLPPLGIYEQVLVDWVLRLDQIPANVYKDHPGLKREVDRIRLQQGITKRKPASS